MDLGQPKYETHNLFMLLNTLRTGRPLSFIRFILIYNIMGVLKDGGNQSVMFQSPSGALVVVDPVEKEIED